MKTVHIYSTICLLLSFTITIYTQHLLPELIQSPVLIQSDYGQGSGFYLQDSTYCYFVTARHNLFNKEIKNNKIIIDTVKSMKLISYPGDPSSSEQNVVNINLEKAFQNNLVNIDQSQDIAVVLIGNTRIDDNKQWFVDYLDIVRKEKSSKITPVPILAIQTFQQCKLGDDVFIFGYPTSLGYSQESQYNFERPLIRKGVIAGKNYDKHTIIIDCPSYPGNSGGPVIVRFSETLGITT